MASIKSVPGSSLQAVDRACDQFEAQWREGHAPSIEGLLATVPLEARPAAVRELIGLEVELRRKRGELVSWDEYLQRFAEYRTVVEALARPSALEATTPAREGDTQPGSATTSTRYKELRFFRRGGLGTLYHSIDESLHREAVVKFMNEQSERDPQLVAQFKVEAEVTSRLDHPGIVPVYGIGEDWRGRPFYVMRLIHGRELKEAIVEYHSNAGGRRGAKGRQLLFNLLEHLVSACNTIAYAHHVGVVHCDIKPSNIMIGKYGETFVLDWGLATNFERTSTFFSPNEPTMRPHSASGSSVSGQRGGTYGYVSPEQLLTDGPIGPPSDVYSLGATLYEILAGRPPFNGRDTNVREQIREGHYPALRSVAPGVCRKLEAICTKAMSLSPQDRYPTASLLANDLTNWMRDEELFVSPDRWYQRLGRFARRHRGVAAASFVALLSVIVAAALTIRSIEVAAYEQQRRAQDEELNLLRAATANAERTGLTTALDTLEELSRPFANGEMSNLGVFRPMVEGIKNFAANYLEHFEAEPAMRPHTARVLELRGVLRMYSNEAQLAIEDLQRAKDLYAAAPTAAGEKYERDLRLTQNSLSQGRLQLQLNQLEAAGQVLAQARDELETMQKSHPDDRHVVRQLAEAMHCLGELEINRRLSGPGRERALLAAETLFKAGQQLREQLVQSADGEEELAHLRDLARSLGYLGDVYLAQGHIRQAKDDYERSRKLRDKLYRLKKDDPEHRFQYARGLGNFGRLTVGHGGELQATIDMLVEGDGIQQELVDTFPEALNFASDLGGTLNTLSELYLFAAQADATRADELRTLAAVAAKRSASVYASLCHLEHADGPLGLAYSQLISATLLRDQDPAAAQRLAAEADQLLTALGPTAKLTANELFLRAWERCLQNEPEATLEALQLAVQRGENEAFRLERHAGLGFKSIAEHARWGSEFKTLTKKVRSTLSDD